jgi:hypothetical protein
VLVLELKCVDRLANEHTARCLNYLRASGRLCVSGSISRNPRPVEANRPWLSVDLTLPYLRLSAFIGVQFTPPQ